jgi:hypothetical protein
LLFQPSNIKWEQLLMVLSALSLCFKVIRNDLYDLTQVATLLVISALSGASCACVRWKESAVAALLAR